jgi:hypothetical protein
VELPQTEQLSGEELELLKLLDLQALLEAEAPDSVPKKVEPGRSSNFSSGEESQIRSKLRELEARNEELLHELKSIKVLLHQKSEECLLTEKQLSALVEDRKKTTALLQEKEKEFEKKLTEREEAYIRGIQEERKAFETTLNLEKEKFDERVEREKEGRKHLEEEKHQQEAALEKLKAELSATKSSVAQEHKSAEQIQAQLQAAKILLERKAKAVEEAQARLKILEAEKTLLSHQMEQKQKGFASELQMREREFHSKVESEKKQFEEQLHKERVEADSKLIRERAVRQTLEEQKKAYNERMVELAWQLKETQRNKEEPKISPVPKAQPEVKKILVEEKAPEPVAKEIPLREVAPRTIISAEASALAPEWRRLAAGLIDVMFVQTLWMMAVVLTANAFTGFTVGISPDILPLFLKPVFFRLVMGEYFALWAAYAVVALGVLNRTCGMWVWDIKVDYGSVSFAGLIAKRSLRVLTSFLAFSLILPLPFLLIVRRRKNFIDVISQSSVVTHEIGPSRMDNFGVPSASDAMQPA